jgi:hypothetical protein
MKAKFFFIVAAFAAMGISANAQGTWKVLPTSEDVLKGDEIANIQNLAVTHSFDGPDGTSDYLAKVKSDSDAPVVSYNGVVYDNQTILQADGVNGQYYFFSPVLNGRIDVANKMGNEKKTFVFEIDPVAVAIDLGLEELTVADILGTLSKGVDIAQYSATPIVKVDGKNPDGTDIVPVPDGTWDGNAFVNPTSGSQWLVLSFPVTGGKSYAVGVIGSKFQLIGINYTLDGTAIDTVIADGLTTVSGYYNFIGQRLPSAPEKGAYIVTYTNGTSRKVLKN